MIAQARVKISAFNCKHLEFYLIPLPYVMLTVIYIQSFWSVFYVLLGEGGPENITSDTCSVLVCNPKIVRNVSSYLRMGRHLVWRCRFCCRPISRLCSVPRQPSTGPATTPRLAWSCPSRFSSRRCSKRAASPRTHRCSRPAEHMRTLNTRRRLSESYILSL